MATTLFIKTATGGTLNFIEGTDYELEDGGLQINPPNIKEEFAARLDGEVPTNKNISNRTVSIRFSVYGTSEDDLIANLAALDKAFTATWDYYTTHGSGEVATLGIKVGSETNTHYLWILSGKVILPGNTFSVAQISQWDAAAGRYFIRGVQVTLTCKPLFYGLDPTNLNQFGNYIALPTSALDLDNQADGTDDNGKEVTNVAKGDYKVPLFYWLRPDGGANTRVILGIGKTDGTYDWRRYVKEGEGASLWYGVTSESTQNDVGVSSSDQYKRFSVSTQDDRSAWCRWDNYPPARGIFRIFAIFKNNVPANIKCQIRLGFSQSVSDFGPISYRPSSVSELYTLDMGSFYNPHADDPFLAASSPERPTVWLYFWTTDGVSTQVDFDALYFIPQDYCYRVYEFTGDPLLYTSTLSDDAFRDSVSGTDYFDAVAMVEALHDPLWLPANTPFVVRQLMLGGTLPTYGGLEYRSGIGSYGSILYVPASLTYGGF